MTTFVLPSYLSMVFGYRCKFWLSVPSSAWCWWITVVSISSLVYARAPKVTSCQRNFWLSVPSSAWCWWIAVVSMSSLVYNARAPKWLAGRWWNDCVVAWSPPSWFIVSEYEKLYVNPKFLVVSYFFVNFIFFPQYFSLPLFLSVYKRSFICHLD